MQISQQPLQRTHVVRAAGRDGLGFSSTSRGFYPEEPFIPRVVVTDQISPLDPDPLSHRGCRWLAAGHFCLNLAHLQHWLADGSLGGWDLGLESCLASSDTLPRRTAEWLPRPCHGTAEPAALGKSLSGPRVSAAQSWVTGPELLAPAVVSRHKVRKCVGQGSWEGRGSLSALRQ